MRILLAGGGTGGPVSPLLAVAEEIKKIAPSAKFCFVGTKKGPERQMVQSFKIPFYNIPAGKLRRYYSWQNFISPLFIAAGFIKSLYLLKKIKPDCVFGAGSFAQVPLIWAAWVLKIPSLIHQQDIIPSLANKLCQMPASKITVTFQESLKDFSNNLGLFYFKHKVDKLVCTGNPIKAPLKAISKHVALEYFHLSKDLPVLLVLGGGTGSLFINKLIADSLPKLGQIVQIIHSTGKNKGQVAETLSYKPFEFIDRMDMAFAAADIVLSRAGLSTISELSFYKKTAIIIPLPRTHQIANAEYLEFKQAALVMPQELMTPEALIYVTRRLLFKYELQEKSSKNIGTIMPHDASEKIAKIIIKLIG